MDCLMTLIFLVLSITADINHANAYCNPTFCSCHLNNVEVLEQLVDSRIRAALASVPGIYRTLMDALLLAVYNIDWV